VKKISFPPCSVAPRLPLCFIIITRTPHHRSRRAIVRKQQKASATVKASAGSTFSLRKNLLCSDETFSRAPFSTPAMLEHMKRIICLCAYHRDGGRKCVAWKRLCRGGRAKAATQKRNNIKKAEGENFHVHAALGNIFRSSLNLSGSICSVAGATHIHREK
jgi:hypothetical protein